MIPYDMIYDMIYLLTKIGLLPGSNSTAHIYTQNNTLDINNTQNNVTD